MFLKVHVDTPSVVFFGSAEEASGRQLRGYVELIFTEPTRIKSLTLHFQGTVQLQWEQSTTKKLGLTSYHQKQHKAKQVVHQKEWTFLPSKNWSHTFAPGPHRYAFELILPGSMMESVDVGGSANVAYGFKAVATRPFASSVVATLPIEVLRQHEDAPGLYYPMMFHTEDDALAAPYTLSNSWDQRVLYHIQLNKQQFRRGEPIYVQFNLKPLIPNLRIRHVSSFLKEYTQLAIPPRHDATQSASMTPMQTIQQHQTSHIVSLARNDQLRSAGHRPEWKAKETLIIPRTGHLVHPDRQHAVIQVSHKVRFTFCFMQGNGQQLDLRVTMPVVILDQDHQQLGNQRAQTDASTRDAVNSRLSMFLDDLPRYEDACLTTPHYDIDWHATSPLSPHTMAPFSPVSPFSPNIASPRDDDLVTPPNDVSIDDYFSYQPCANPMIPLQRVPSYETAIQGPH
ncbi:hypothetical protein BC940DRAFT_272373 [Gongronella butleri]|nr:hypothetical protein BC940DRAFT_272373 [Gongronella butleri]